MAGISTFTNENNFTARTEGNDGDFAQFFQQDMPVFSSCSGGPVPSSVWKFERFAGSELSSGGYVVKVSHSEAGPFVVLATLTDDQAHQAIG